MSDEGREKGKSRAVERSFKDYAGEKGDEKTKTKTKTKTRLSS
jgi:hypothetical protein